MKLPVEPPSSSIRSESKSRQFWRAVIPAAVLAVAGTVFSIYLANDYGTALFALLPYVCGTLSAYLYAKRDPWLMEKLRRPSSVHDFQAIEVRQRSLFWRAYGATMASMGLAGLAMLVVAIEGILCLAMAAPLAALVGLLSALTGIGLARRFHRGQSADKLLIALIAAFPLLTGAEYRLRPEAPIHAITTSIQVKAPAAVVWRYINAYPPISAEPAWFFRCGIGCPMAVRLEGVGVGATRYCDFTTGTFVEPITDWEEGRLLAFDVTSSPPPMKELSLYENLEPPHLHGYWENKRGQFRLTEKDGITTIEGTSWYQHHIAPDFYWHWVSDAIVRQIHRRVLTHIKTLCEAAPAQD